MQCKNCGVEVDSKDLEWLKKEEDRLQAELNDIAQRITALEQGFCDPYCQSLFEGEA